MISTRCNPMPADTTRRKMLPVVFCVLIPLVCFPNFSNSLMLDTNLVSHLKTKWEIILNQPFLCHLHFHTILQFTVVLISNRTSRQIISHGQNTINISSCTDGKIATVFLSHRNNRKKMQSCLEPVVSFNSTLTVQFEGKHCYSKLFSFAKKFVLCHM